MDSYQAAIDRVDSLISFISMIATVFGVITALVVGFFAVRQISVDREANLYKRSLKKHQEEAEREALEFKNVLEREGGWIKDQKEKITKQIETLSAKGKIGKVAKKELEDLKEKVASLETVVNVSKGLTYAVRPTELSSSMMSSSSPLGGWYAGSRFITCKKCNHSYTENSDPFLSNRAYSDSASLLSFVSDNKESGSKCPNCGNIN